MSYRRTKVPLFFCGIGVPRYYAEQKFRAINFSIYTYILSEICSS